MKSAVIVQFLGCRIGDTSFYQSGYQEGEIGERLTVNGVRPVVYVKREDQNEPTRTIKVRPVAAALQTYADMDDVILVGPTCGHLGEAGVEFCHRYQSATGKRRRFASIVDKRDLDRINKRRLSRHGSFFIEADLDGRYITSSEMIEMVERELGMTTTVIPVGGIDISGEGYKALARELYRDGVRHDWVVYLPLGGGEMLLNMGLQFEELGEMPHFVAATTPDNLYSIERYETASTGLGAEFSHLETAVQDFIRKYEIPVVTVKGPETFEEFKYVRDVAKIPTCRESAVAFAAARKHALERHFTDGQKIVVINTGYDEAHQPSLSSKLGQYATRAAAALLVSSLVAVGSGVNESSTRARMHEESRKWHIDYTKHEIQNNPEFNDIYAYALWRGNIEQIDQKVLFNLSTWYVYHDMIAREMYRNNLNGMRDDVESFGSWKKQQENARKARFERFTKSP